VIGAGLRVGSASQSPAACHWRTTRFDSAFPANREALEFEHRSSEDCLEVIRANRENRKPGFSGS
jgi:hypothetical protein